MILILDCSIRPIKNWTWIVATRIITPSLVTEDQIMLFLWFSRTRFKVKIKEGYKSESIYQLRTIGMSKNTTLEVAESGVEFYVILSQFVKEFMGVFNILLIGLKLSFWRIYVWCNEVFCGSEHIRKQPFSSVYRLTRSIVCKFCFCLLGF